MIYDKWHIELLTKAFNSETRRAGILRFDKKEFVRLKTALDALKESEDRYSKLTEILYNGKADVAKAYGKNADEVIYDHLEKIILNTLECQPIFAIDPKVSPNTDTLFYYYDYGDAWCIKITSEEIYIEGESGRYTDTNNNDVSAELNTRFCDAAKKKRPVCIETDGINVLDDVGGISGFESFLKTVNDASDPERKETLLSWAKMLGWTGKLTKAENML